MGLLDDAIREHLELKRRHGADPQEVARQEDEALGPIGGHEPQRDDAEAEATDDREHDVPVLHAPEPEFVFDEPPAPAEEPAAVHADQRELDLPPLAEEAAEEPAEPADVAEPEDDVHQPTVEYSIADAPEPPKPPASAPEPGEEPGEPADELEETPEFLQETPEHDRLWFEQKPPRDFDF